MPSAGDAEGVDYIPAATRGDVAPGRSILRTVGDSEILICNIGGEFHAIENKCSHLGKPLFGGRLMGTTITCPFHSASFDVRDGAPKDFPASRPIRCFPSRVNGDVIEVATGTP